MSIGDFLEHLGSPHEGELTPQNQMLNQRMLTQQFIGMYAVREEVCKYIKDAIIIHF